MSNWPLVAASRLETLGIASGAGTAVTSGAANTYGTPVKIGTTGFGYSGFFLRALATPNTACRISVILGSGGPVIVEDVFADMSGISGQTIPDFFCPIHVPSGKDLYVKMQCITASQTADFTITGYRQDFPGNLGFSRMVGCTDFTNTMPANSVTQNGTSQTASWTVIRSSTPQRLAGIFFRASRNGDSSRTVSEIDTVIAIGGAGAEQAFHETLFRQNGVAILPDMSFVPCDLPASTRLSFKAACAAAAVDSMSMAAWGICA